MNDENPVDLDALAALLKREYAGARQYNESLSLLQDQAFRYYEGQPFGNEVDGRSQVILPDVQETIDYMSQSVLRTFVSGEFVVEFEADNEADEPLVEEATEAINYNFMRQQDGFRILHDGLNDGLLRKIGIFKTVQETEEKVETKTVVLDPVQLGEMPDDVGLLDAEENEDGSVTATIRTERMVKRFVDYAIPPQRFKFSANARHEDDADYLCHDEPRTRSDLVEMGFDVDQVYRLPTYSVHSDLTLTESNTLDNWRQNESSPELEQILLCEEYARIDVDGDGVAERVKVFRVENEILIDAETGEPSIEQVEDHPFSVFCPFPRPHRLVGYSLADKVMDLQLIRSFVARQLMDGMAFSNLPRQIVDSTRADETTYKDILSPIPGSPIRVPGGASSVQPVQTGFNAAQSLSVMEWLTGERESRTGITRMNQGLDADALNKTATGTALMQAAGQQGEEMIARQLAEALSRVFVKKYRLMREMGESFNIKVDGQYKQVDPAKWPEAVSINVNVGLGTNNKDRRVQYRMALGDPLRAALQAGMAGPEHVFKWFDGIARDTAIGTGEDFVYSPEQMQQIQQQQPEQPDPEQQKLEGQMQLQAMKLQGEQQLSGERIQLMREEAAAKAQLDRDKAEFEARQAEEKFAFEAEMARRKMMFEAAARADISANRPGGRLDA